MRKSNPENKDHLPKVNAFTTKKESNNSRNLKSVWEEKWDREKHTLKKKQTFHQIDSYLKSPPSTILDIGCGYAKESEFFYKKYNSSLYINVIAEYKKHYKMHIWLK